MLMCKMLLSINPEHVENIFLGIKRFEFRKRRCKRNIDKIVIYATYPIKRVVGEADVEEIYEGSTDAIWKKTSEGSGISKQFFDEYYKNHKTAVAYKLGNIEKFDKPRPLSFYGVKSAPQSFIYVN